MKSIEIGYVIFYKKSKRGAGLNRPPSPSPPEGRAKESRTAVGKIHSKFLTIFGQFDKIF